MGLSENASGDWPRMQIGARTLGLGSPYSKSSLGVVKVFVSRKWKIQRIDQRRRESALKREKAWSFSEFWVPFRNLKRKRISFLNFLKFSYRSNRSLALSLSPNNNHFQRGGDFSEACSYSIWTLEVGPMSVNFKFKWLRSLIFSWAYDLTMVSDFKILAFSGSN